MPNSHSECGTFHQHGGSESIPNHHLTTSFLELQQFPFILVWVLQKAEDKMKSGMKVTWKCSRAKRRESFGMMLWKAGLN